MQKSSFNIWRGGARALQLFAKIWMCLALCVFAMGCKSAEVKIYLHYSKNILYVCGAGYFKINQDATNINYKTETKIRGRRTAESAAVLSRHRFGVSSSDLPSLFNNQNFNVMLDTMDNCATCAQKPITAEEIIKDILIWNDPENIREDLHEMMLAFFMHYESPTEEFKGRIYCTYTTLYNALKQMETLNTRRAKQ
jgi:hypothetical protein